MADESIIVVEDEPPLAEALRFNLVRQGYRVTVVHDGHLAVREIERAGPDLVVLDVMLPGLDGFEVCRRVRMRSDVPILMLTARGEEVDRVLGLEIGADDYLTKPFSLREFQARVRALLRRSTRSELVDRSEPQQAGNLRISAGERRAWIGDAEIHLRPREFDLLAYLVRNQSLALSRQQILDGAWGSDFAGDERTVDVHVKALRDLVEDDPRHPTRIVTVRGVGYRFEG
jgi:DNA-binding response OmpR family regulator